LSAATRPTRPLLFLSKDAVGASRGSSNAEVKPGDRDDMSTG
jgi:hypothetical protein